MAAIQLKDLIQAQQKLKQKDGAAPERMSIEEFRRMSSGLDKIQQSQEKSAQKQEDLLKKGLADKSGDGLNSNVIKLTAEIKKAALSGKVSNAKPAAPAGNDATMEQRAREQAGRHVGGVKDAIKEKWDFDMPAKGSGIKGWAGALKGNIAKMGTAEWWTDTSEGKNMSGIGGAMRRRAESNQYVKDRFATEDKRYFNLLEKDKQGNLTPAAKAKAEATFRRQYSEQQEARGGMKRNEAEIERLRNENYSDDDIKRAGLFDKRAGLDESLQKSDPRYRRQRKADNAVATPETSADIIPIGRGKKKGAAEAVMSSVAGLVGGGAAAPVGEETETENLRLMNQQNELLKQIAANTAGGKPQGVGGQQPGPAQAEGGGGSLLGDVANLATDFLGRGKGGMSRMAGRAAPMLRSAGGFLSRNVGKIGAIGGVAMGAYDAYQGWNAADEKLAAGEITEDEANVEKGSAVGGGVGGAGGAWAGAAAGAAIGSVVPGIGTAIGGLIGGTVGYIGGSAAGKKIGEYGTKAYQGVRDFFGGGSEDQTSPEQKASVSDKLKDAAKMAIPGVGMASMLMGGVKGAGDWISEKVGYVKDQAGKDLSGGVGVEQAEQMVSSNQQLNQSSQNGANTTTLNQGVTAQKSIFGSTTLGTLFSKKGQETGTFMGQGSEEKESADGQVSAQYGTILGKRVSGGLFGRDSYTATLEGKDGGGTYDEKFNKSQYMEMQKLAGDGKYDEAEAKFKEFKQANEDAAASVAGPSSPEEVGAPGEGAAKGMSLGDIWGKAKKAGGSILSGIGSWVGDKVGKVKDVFNRGVAGTAEAQNMSDEVQKRAQEAGIIDEKGEITDFNKYNEISQGVRKDITAKDPNAFVLADQKVQANSSMEQQQVSGAGGTTGTSNFKEGVTAQKSILGSTFLGSLFTKKGLETGTFSANQEDVAYGADGKTDAKYSSVLGRRISGGLFGADTYKVSGSSGDEMDVSKGDYNKLQKLAAEGKSAEAEAMMAQIKERQATAPAYTGMESAFVPTPSSAEQVYQKSGENAAAAAQPVVAPSTTVINSPTTNNQQTQNYSPKGPARNTDSSVQQYNRARFAF